MKTLLKTNLSFLLISFFCISLHSQDSQWYIDNGKMRQYDNWSNTYDLAGDSIVIKGIGKPNTSCISKAKDDFFVLFDNGMYYNSRYRSTSFSYKVDSIYLRNSTSANIRYLYASNLYDIDPPPDLRIGVYNSDDPSTTHNLIDSTLNPNIISANHDVLLGKDITLILNLSAIEVDSYFLSTNEIIFSPLAVRQAIADGVEDFEEIVTNSGSFESTDIFDRQFYLTNRPENVQDISFTDDGIHFSIKKKDNNLLYLNFNSANLDEYRLSREVEDAFDSEDYTAPENDPFNKVLFKLYKGDKRNNEILASHKEDIRHSHDPNYITADALCKDSDNNEYVQYVCEFENITNEVAKKLRVELKLPTEIDVNEIKLLTATANGEPLDLDDIFIATTKDRVTSFTFHKETSIQQCDKELVKRGKASSQSGIVNFRFCAKVEGNLSEEHNAYNVSDAYTVFDYGDANEARYNLDFKDEICKKKGQSKLYDTACDRSVTICDDCNSNLSFVIPRIIYLWLFLYLLLVGFLIHKNYKLRKSIKDASKDQLHDQK